jgi:hypothetical protein
VAFVHLSGSFEEIAALLSSRRDHFMPVSLLESQLNTLEPLEPDENGIVVQLGQQPQDEATRSSDALDWAASSHRLSTPKASPIPEERIDTRSILQRRLGVARWTSG